MPQPLRVFIGYDPRQAIAYNVLQFSLLRRSSVPLAVTPLVKETLPPIDREGLTPFTYTRFLVPWLCDYQGPALFLDLDMLCVSDIAEMLVNIEDQYPVLTVNTDPAYERAAVMLFNCGHPDNKRLTMDYIETAPDLHLIGWTERRGTLGNWWNHLVGYDAPREDACLIHYTMGIPVHKETMDCEHADKWVEEHRAMVSTRPWQELMGHSNHAGRIVPRVA